MAASQSTSSTAYTDLATTGPFVTKQLVAGQKVLVYVSFFGSTATDANEQYMSFGLTGASGTISASDANAAHYFAVKTGINTGGQVGRWTVYTATNTGSHTFTAKYKTASGATPNFADRRIIIKSF